MLRIAVVIGLLAGPAIADPCGDILRSIDQDFIAATNEAARVAQRRFDLFSLSSQQTDTQLQSVADQTGIDMSAILLEAERKRRADRASISMLCPTNSP